MPLQFMCCNCKENTILDMQEMSNKELEKIITDLLQDYGVDNYKFTWKTNKLPCDIRYLEGRIHSDLHGHSYSSIDIIISLNSITLQYDNIEQSESQIFLNILT